MSIIKKVVSLCMVFALAVSGLGFTKTTNAGESEIDSWKSNAVIAPAEGKLVGAGYIPVEFNNTMEGYTYKVLLDGEPMYWNGDDIVKTDIGEKVTGEDVIKSFSYGDEGKTEVYTTDISKHVITIVASDGNNEYTSDPRTFYVSKKGIALGSDMTDKIKMKDLNVSWYYNWATDPINSEVDENVDHVPMMWGGGDDNIEAMQSFNTDSNYILGFNEPDIKSQANMNFWDATEVWNNYISPLENIRKISPAPALPNGTSPWLKKFMYGDYICLNTFLNDGSWGLYKDYEDEASKKWVEGVNDDVDAVVLHYYQGKIDFNGLVNAVENLWNEYHKPVWVTEVSVAGMKGKENDFSYEIPEKRAEMAEFVTKMCNALDDIPYVERYCWFSYNIQSANEIDGITGSGATAMFDYETGNYTELGRTYSSLGNPQGYEANTITDDMMYVYVPPVTTTSEPTTAQPTTVAPTTTNAVATSQVETKVTTETTADKKNALGRTSIKKLKNVKKKSVKISLKKVAGATKYEVQYSLKKNFKKVSKKILKKPSFKITKLKKGKKYYFRARAINGNLYGKWSKIKQIKIKK